MEMVKCKIEFGLKWGRRVGGENEKGRRKEKRKGQKREDEREVSGTQQDNLIMPHAWIFKFGSIYADIDPSTTTYRIEHPQ